MIAVLSSAACDAPNLDAFRTNGGAALDPTAVIRGSVLYIGPKPDCQRDENGTAVDITGKVIMTMTDASGVVPGTGGLPQTLIVDGRHLFALSDCMPTTPDTTTITRSAGFEWGGLTTGRLPCMPDPDGGAQVCPPRTVRISGLYDNDGDYVPTSPRNVATYRDVSGLLATPIPLGNIAVDTNGLIVEGVTLTLSTLNNTERPIFELDPGTGALDSTTAVPEMMDATTEETLWQETRMRVNALVSASMPNPTQEWLDLFAAAGIDTTHYTFGSAAYGFYVLTGTLNSMTMMVASHPIFGAAGFKLWSPSVTLTRARSPIEVRLGLPTVTQTALLRPSVGSTTRSLLSFDAVVLPVARIAFSAECAVTIAAPGTPETVLSGMSWTDCQELPSGNYDVALTSGVNNGVAVPEVTRCTNACVMGGGDMASCMTMCEAEAPMRSQNGWAYVTPAVPGASPATASTANWTIPNPLGCVDSVYSPTLVNPLDPLRPDGTYPTCETPDETVLIPSQGRGGTWSVVDVADDPMLPGPETRDTTAGHGHPQCFGNVASVAPSCCPATILKFCGLPLCPLRDAGVEVPPETLTSQRAPYAYPEAVRPVTGGAARTTREIRVPGEDYTVAADGTVTPLCTPFLMPVDCCRMAMQ